MVNHPFQIRFTFAALGLLLVLVHFFFFDQFFPNGIGGLGHDYSLFFPALLDGVFWYQNNGWLSVPWFTPSFCGGLPKYANPNAAFYSVPQFISFLVSPLSSIKWTLFIFAGFGYSGFYVLLRRVFQTTRLTALLGATLFLFNGFYVHRMIIGHLTYHPFMLIPWIAYFNCRILSKQTPFAMLKESSGIAISGVMVAYMFFAGMVNLIVPAILSVGIIGLIRQFQRNSLHQLIKFIVRITLSCFLALILCASQLGATWVYLKNFPRDFYPLPGIPNLLDIVVIVFRSLFWESAFKLEQAVRVNKQWLLDRHELEMGVTFIPLFLILLGVLLNLKSPQIFQVWKRWDRKLWGYLGVIMILLILPLTLNYYTPEWNAILKQIPIIKSSSTLVRWYSIYIPFVILLSVLVLEKTPILRQYNVLVVGISIALILLLNIFTDRGFYHEQRYNHRNIETIYQQMKEGKFTPQIQEVSLGKNFMQHASKITCYEPIFGYRLESFPVKTLHEGPALEKQEEWFNIKNPACYLFPEENQCSPGDHFTTSQIQEAQSFLNYQTYSFNFSSIQKIFNYLSLIAWIGVFLFLVGGGIYLLVQKRSKMMRFREPQI